MEKKTTKTTTKQKHKNMEPVLCWPATSGHGA